MGNVIYGDFAANDPPKLDVLCFGPHPDDAEIGAGGVLLKMAQAGYKVGIIDLTEGEMGSGGTVEIRREESRRAAEILNLTVRENMQLPDCGVEDNFENRSAVGELIRKYRPDVVLGPYYDLPPGRGLGHNDHIKGGLIVAHGANYAHLKKMAVDYEPWYPKAIYYYFLPPELMPSFVVDVTEQYEGWLNSILAHESQFGKAEQNQGMRDFFGGHATRWARWASGRYAQAFYSQWPLPAENLLTAAHIEPPVKKPTSAT